MLLIILFQQSIILKLNETLDKMYVIQILQCNLQSRAIPFDVPRRLSFLLPHLHFVAKGNLGSLRCFVMLTSGTLWQFNETVARGWSTFRYFSHQRSSQYMAHHRGVESVASGLKEGGRCLGWTWQRRERERHIFLEICRGYLPKGIYPRV